MANFLPKSENLLASICNYLATIDVMQLDVPAQIASLEIFFWTLFYNLDHCGLPEDRLGSAWGLLDNSLMNECLTVSKNSKLYIFKIFFVVFITLDEAQFWQKWRIKLCSTYYLLCRLLLAFFLLLPSWKTLGKMNLIWTCVLLLAANI